MFVRWPNGCVLGVPLAGRGGAYLEHLVDGGHWNPTACGQEVADSWVRSSGWVSLNIQPQRVGLSDFLSLPNISPELQTLRSNPYLASFLGHLKDKFSISPPTLMQTVIPQDFPSYQWCHPLPSLSWTSGPHPQLLCFPTANPALSFVGFTSKIDLDSIQYLLFHATALVCAMVTFLWAHWSSQLPSAPGLTLMVGAIRSCPTGISSPSPPCLPFPLALARAVFWLPQRLGACYIYCLDFFPPAWPFRNYFFCLPWGLSSNPISRDTVPDPLASALLCISPQRCSSECLSQSVIILFSCLVCLLNSKLFQ